MSSKPENNQKLLVLDIDETLVLSTEGKPLPQGYDFTVLGDIYVLKRPGLDKFFARASAAYRIGFWSAGGSAYVPAVLQTIVPTSIQPEFIWSGERCTWRRDFVTGFRYVIKDLNKLRRKGYDLNRTVIADNDPTTAPRNYGNLIPVQTFTGEAGDNELEYLADYLLSIRDVDNFRSLEKRNWRAPFLAQKKVG